MISKIKEDLTREEIMAAASPSTDSDRRCEECGIVFQNRGAKALHLLKTHNIGGSKSEDGTSEVGASATCSSTPKNNFQCCDCDKVFKSRKLLVQHFQKVHKPKSIACSKCEKTFALDRDLRYHQINRCQKGIKRGAETPAGPSEPKKSSTVIESFLQHFVELPSNFKIIDTSKMVSISTQTCNQVHDAGLQVYLEQPYYDGHQQYATQTDPIYINQQTSNNVMPRNGIPCQTYTDWRHTETQTQNLTSTIGTITPYWPQENGYANESATQTWYSSLEPMTQMTDNFSMTDNYPMIYDNASE